MTTITLTTIREDRDGNETPARQHIFRESDELFFTGNEVEETSARSLCGKIKAMLDGGGWVAPWNEVLTWGDEKPDGNICKTCLKISQK